MEIQEVLKVLKDGAEKPKNKTSDYLKAKSDGLMEAYSHAWTLVKNLALSGVMPSVYVVTYNDDYGRPIFDNCFNDKTIAEEYIQDHDYLRMDNTTVIKEMDFE